MDFSGPILRRNVLWTAGTVIGVIGVAACGVTGQSPASGTAAAKPAAKPATIEFIHRWGGAREALVKQQIDAFRTKYPHITINDQLIDGRARLNEKVISLLVAGTPPDVTMTGSEDSQGWMVRGLLKALDEQLKRDKLEPKQVFYPVLVPPGQRGVKTYALPQLTPADRPYLFWNVEAFKGAGLDPKRGPKSWDELAEFSQKLTKREGAGFSSIGLDFPGAPFMDWLGRNDGKVVTDDAKKVLFNDQRGVETLQWMADSTNRLYGNAAAVGDFLKIHRTSGTGGSRAPQYTGKQAMWITGVWHFFEAKEEHARFNPNFEYGVDIAPHSARNPRAKPISLSDRVNQYAIPQGAKEPDATWEWLKYITLGEGNRAFVKAQGRPSPVTKFNDDPDFQKQNPYWNTLVKQSLGLMFLLPPSPVWSDAQKALDNVDNVVLAGKKSVKEALDEAAAEVQRLLDEAPR
ncbi:MAG: extracellular solute-binding protein [Chloroflexi bacterium]|nr:extracellular solute-binding protein [Chloroflexota bacterium]